jgi:hypothetical protein
MADWRNYLGALNVRDALERSDAQIEAMSTGNVGYSGHGGPGPVMKGSPNPMLRGAPGGNSYARFYRWMGDKTEAPADPVPMPMGVTYDDFFKSLQTMGREQTPPDSGKADAKSPLPTVDVNSWG